MLIYDKFYSRVGKSKLRKHEGNGGKIKLEIGTLGYGEKDWLEYDINTGEWEIIFVQFKRTMMVTRGKLKRIMSYMGKSL